MERKHREETRKAVFRKEQWKKSKLFQGRQDIVEAVLQEEQVYTKAEVLAAVQEYLTGKREER